MKQDKENPTVIIELTEGQTIRIKNWSGCVFSNVIVAAYKEDSETSRETLPIELESHQIREIEKSFSNHSLKGKRIMVYPPRDEEMEEKPVKAVAVLEKHVTLPSNPISVTYPKKPDPRSPEYDPPDIQTCCCGDF